MLNAILLTCTCPVDCSVIIKWQYNFYFPLDGHASKKEKKKKKGRLVSNSTKKRLFQAFTAVSGSSSAGEGCTDTNAYLKTLRIPWFNPFALEKGGGPGRISFCKLVL